MRSAMVLVFVAGVLGGCGGEFAPTVPDAVGPTAGVAPTTVRVQRHEFGPLLAPLKDAVVTLSAKDGGMRAGYTDKNGYALVPVPLPDTAGQYALKVHHMDRQGDEFDHTARAYAMDPRLLVVAVDWNVLQAGKVGQPSPAAEALTRLAKAGVQVIYLSPRRANDPEPAHYWLSQNDYPDGPIITWQLDRDWLGRTVKVYGPMALAHEQLPGLVLGVTREDDVARAFGKTQIVPLWMGRGAPEWSRPVANWSELADVVLNAKGLLGVQNFQGFGLLEVHQLLDNTTTPAEIVREKARIIREILAANGATQPTSAPTTEPTTEPTTQAAEETTTEPAPKPVNLETIVAPQSESQPASQPGAQPASQPETQPQAEPTSQPESQPEAQPASQPETQPQTAPTSQPEPQAGTQPQTEPESQPETQPQTEPASQPESPAE